MPTFVPNKTVSGNQTTGTFVPSKGSSGKPARKRKPHGVGGFFTNLAHGAERGILGAPKGVFEVGKAASHDTASVFGRLPGASTYARQRARERSRLLPVGRALVHPYVQLATHPGRYAREFYADPFAGTMAFLPGVGLAGKALLPATAERSILLRAPNAEAGAAVSKYVSPKKLQGHTQLLAHRAAQKVAGADQTGPVRGRLAQSAVGEQRRWARASAARAQAANKNLLSQAEPQMRVINQLKKPEQVAAFWRNELPDTASFERYKQHLASVKTPASQKTLRIISSAKVSYLYHSPSKRMVKATQAVSELGAQHRFVLGDMLFGEEARPYLSERLTRGATFEDGALAGPSAGEVAADLQAKGLTDPAYLPHRAGQGRKMTGKASAGGGLGTAKLPGELKQNKGSLFLAGQLAQTPAVLNDAFLNATKWAHHTDLRNRAMAGAQKFHSDTVPDGYTLIRQPANPRLQTVAGKQQIVAKSSKPLSAMERQQPEFNRWAQQHMKDLESGDATENSLFTKDSTQAETDASGQVMAIPDGVAKSLVGEFRSQSTLIRLVNKYPMKVWRAMVLGLRPAWLVNNILGNTLMYLMHNSGPEGLAALAKQFREMVHPGSRGEFDALMRKHFGDQLGGTFVGTSPGLAFQGLAKVDRSYEQALRKAATQAFLKKHPVVKQRVKAMREETHSFWGAASRELDKDPELARVISQQVNDSLGNFSNLSHAEQTFVRAVFPFYAWYRAITAVTLKLPLTAPVKSGLLLQLNNITGGAQEPGAGWLQSYIGVGDKKNGRTPSIGTQGLFPYSTVPQVTQSAYGLAGSHSTYNLGRSLGLLAPEFASFVATVTGKNPVTNRPFHPIWGGYPVNVPYSIIRDFPQTQLALSLAGRGQPNANASGKQKFTEHTPWTDFLRFMGLPYNNTAR